MAWLEGMVHLLVGDDTKGFGDLDLKKGVDHDLKLEKGEVWNKI